MNTSSCRCPTPSATSGESRWRPSTTSSGRPGPGSGRSVLAAAETSWFTLHYTIHHTAGLSAWQPFRRGVLGSRQAQPHPTGNAQNTSRCPALPPLQPHEELQLTARREGGERLELGPAPRNSYPLVRNGQVPPLANCTAVSTCSLCAWPGGGGCAQGRAGGGGQGCCLCCAGCHSHQVLHTAAINRFSGPWIVSFKKKLEDMALCVSQLLAPDRPMRGSKI